MSTNVSDECYQSFEVSTSVTFMELTLGDYTMLMNGNNSTLFSTALSSEPHEVPSIIKVFQKVAQSHTTDQGGCCCIVDFKHPGKCLNVPIWNI